MVCKPARSNRRAVLLSTHGWCKRGAGGDSQGFPFGSVWGAIVNLPNAIQALFVRWPHTFRALPFALEEHSGSPARVRVAVFTLLFVVWCEIRSEACCKTTGTRCGRRGSRSVLRTGGLAWRGIAMHTLRALGRRSRVPGGCRVGTERVLHGYQPGTEWVLDG